MVLGLLFVLIIAGAAGVVWFLRARHTPQPAATIAIRTVKAVRGTLQRTLRMAGSITAGRFAVVTAPMLQARESSGLDLISMTPSGTNVKKDQVVAELDARSMRDHLDDMEAQVDQLDKELLKLAADRAAEGETIRQRARVAKATLEQARLNAQAGPVKTQIDREILKLAVAEAEENYSQAERQVALYEELHSAQANVAALRRASQVRHRDRHRNDIARCTVKSPLNGYTVVTTIHRHGGEEYQVRVGDQLNPGQPFMRIVDLSSVRLDGAVNQSEIERLRIGQRARIRFDAYPDLMLNGRIEAVGSLALGGRRVNYYVRQIPVRIALEGRDPRVIPDLTASADVVIGGDEEGLLVPREAIREENGKSLVYVKQQEGGFAPREVEVGGYNNTYASITSGLDDGAEIAAQAPGS